MAYQVHIGRLTLDIPPERKIDFGGNREYVRQDIPGTHPIYQDMGPAERTLRFSGVIDGDGALEKALEIQKLSDEAKEVKFLYTDISAQVIIRSFSYSYFRTTRVRYDIELVVLGDVEPKPVNMVQAPKPVFTVPSPVMQIANAIKTVTHWVQQGQSLRSIATRLYHNPHDWMALARLNRLTKGIIPPGMRSILVPANISALRQLQSNIATQRATMLPRAPLPVFKSRYSGGGKR